MQNNYFGVGSIAFIEKILKEISPKKIFFVTGRKSYISSGAKEILEPILKDYSVIHFQDFFPNPQLKEVEAGLKELDDDVGAVIAVGGGSVIDIAKAVTILAAQDGEPSMYVKKEKEIARKAKPLIAVPTTAGSGSEATSIAVLYIDKTKHSFSHEYMLPSYTIIDPQLTMSMPKKIAASTALDAFCQAIEAYWSINSTEESRYHSEEAIKIMMNSLTNSVNKPNLELRGEMTKAANLAGKAINIAKTTVCHALSYGISMNFAFPHGYAVSLTLANALKYNSEVTNADCNDKRGPEHVKRVIANLLSFLNCQSVNQSGEFITNLIKDVGLEPLLDKVGIKGEWIDKLVAQVNLQRLWNNPRTFKNTEALKIIMK